LSGDQPLFLNKMIACCIIRKDRRKLHLDGSAKYIVFNLYW
jgi:hypothetical protein